MGIKGIIVFKLEDIIDVDTKISVEVLDSISGVNEVPFEYVALLKKIHE